MEQREKTSSNRMQLLREEKGLNMKEAAAQLQLPYTTYRNYEQGLREPNSETLVQIANFYGVSVDYLIGRSTSRNSVLYDQRPVTIPPGFMPLPRMVKKPLVGRPARSTACATPTPACCWLSAPRWWWSPTTWATPRPAPPPTSTPTPSSPPRWPPPASWTASRTG